MNPKQHVSKAVDAVYMYNHAVVPEEEVDKNTSWEVKVLSPGDLTNWVIHLAEELCWFSEAAGTDIWLDFYFLNPGMSSTDLQ